jgi:predicted XRE-type DNA-binding protein
MSHLDKADRMARTSATDGDSVLTQLIAIKKLLVLELLRDGASQEQVAAALDVNRSQVSRLFPGGLRLKKQATRQ